MGRRRIVAAAVLAVVAAVAAPSGAGVAGPGPSLYVSVTAGDDHSCAITTRGGVECWGANKYGQLGNGTLVDSPTPVRVRGLKADVTRLSAGVGHTCALTTAGTVACWGLDADGQLGDGTVAEPNAQPFPAAVAGLKEIATIDAGDAHTCAVDTAGRALCWGLDKQGQLGDGAMSNPKNRPTPIPVVGLSGKVASVEAGAAHTCAVVAGGTVDCWGNDSHGQLGDGTVGQPEPLVSRPRPGTVVLLSEVAQLTAGRGHTCALKTDGTVACWGLDIFGQLGDGTLGRPNEHPAPTPIVGLTGVASIGGGDHHTCAVFTTGRVFCWGYDREGQLGDGTARDSKPTPSLVVGLGDAIAHLDGGVAHTCALTTAGTIACWGRNTSGQLGG